MIKNMLNIFAVNFKKYDIENGINSKINEFALDFLQVYDDFVRAKEVFSENKTNTDGLDSILKNMDSLLKKEVLKMVLCRKPRRFLITTSF